MCDMCPPRWVPVPSATHDGCKHPFSQHAVKPVRKKVVLRCDAMATIYRVPSCKCTTVRVMTSYLEVCKARGCKCQWRNYDEFRPGEYR